MNITDQIDDVKCICGCPISSDDQKEANEKRWAILMQIKNKIADFIPKIHKYTCSKCRRSLAIENLRRFECNHDYCDQCLTILMKNHKFKTPLKCACGTVMDAAILKEVNDEAFSKYDYNLNMRAAGIIP